MTGPHNRFLGNHALSPETLMMGYGYDPFLSERSLIRSVNIGLAPVAVSRVRPEAEQLANNRRDRARISDLSDCFGGLWRDRSGSP